MLGMTAGAITVYLRPAWFTDDLLNRNTAKACLGYGASVPFSLIMICLVPLQLDQSIMSLFSLIIITVSCSLPFYFSGIAISTLLTKYQLPIGKLYASDLFGASLGCLFVLGGLELLDAPSLILLCGSVGFLAAISLLWNDPGSFNLRRLTLWLFLILTCLALLNTTTKRGIRPYTVKGFIRPAHEFVMEKWNSYSRVTVSPFYVGYPQYWGGSPKAPYTEILQCWMNIDGEAGTTVRGFSSLGDIEHLRFDITNIVYYLRPKNEVCIIGVGGGRDVQSAILFGSKKITGIDLNPLFIKLHQGAFRKVSGIGGREEVHLVTDEARSYLSRTDEKYSVILMSLIDTWAATGAGAFSLSENGLYTLEAWNIFLNRLNDDGVFSVSRYYNPKDLGETGRLVSLAAASLFQLGVNDISRHIALITSQHIATILVSKQPFSEKDIAVLKNVSSEMEYQPAIVPGVLPENQILRNIVSSRSLEELNRATRHKLFNFEPATDSQPYFFNMLRLAPVTRLILSGKMLSGGGIAQGNLRATITLGGLLLSLLTLAIFTIVVPLVFSGHLNKKNASPLFWPGAIYFILIGAGFMLIEIGFVQRLSVFLGHPIYALGILLFTLIASTGAGSFLSEYLPLKRSPGIYVYPLVTVLTIAVTQFLLTWICAQMAAASMMIKIFASIALLFPAGIMLGLFFPTGMHLAKKIAPDQTPWYWALNGVFGVLFSAIAVFISIYFGIYYNFYIAMLCYSAVLICLHRILKSVK